MADLVLCCGYRCHRLLDGLSVLHVVCMDIKFKNGWNFYFSRLFFNELIQLLFQ